MEMEHKQPTHEANKPRIYTYKIKLTRKYKRIDLTPIPQFATFINNQSLENGKAQTEH